MENEYKLRKKAFLKTVGSKLRTARVVAKMTQKEVSKKTGVTRISAIENGKIDVDFINLLNLAKVLGVKISDILP